ncbi:MAG: TldD/PmbA family protein [Polyangiaceae bacterium]|nr:TldD/PmbA family protein [Polyangiaceae bacterium]
MSALLDQAKQVVALAKKKGAADARATAYSSREVELTWRDGKVEKVSEATTRGASVALYVEGRYSSVSTSDLRPEALEKFLEESISMAKTLAKDPYRTLPDPKMYEGRAQLDLALFDPKYETVTADLRRKVAKEIEDGARSVKGAESILSVEAGVSDTKSQSATATSNGFEGEREDTQFWLSGSVSCKDKDGRRPEEYDVMGGHFFSELGSASELGKRASERTIGTLGAAKLKSDVFPLVIENRAGGRMLRNLLGALTGRALQQKQSFLEGKVGKEIASKLLTLTDDPHLAKGLASRLYDTDGFATKKRVVIEKGVLKLFYIDDYYAKKMKVNPTTGMTTNLVLSGGKKNLTELMKDIKNGILVTGFLGGNSNSTTGAFSAGIQGYHIVNGTRAEPIAEMNISGNLSDFWKKLTAVGSDPWVYSSTRTPTLVFDGIQIAGL